MSVSPSNLPQTGRPSRWRYVVVVGVPILVVVALAIQFAPLWVPLLGIGVDVVPPQPVAIARANLARHPEGITVNLLLIDAQGRDVTMDGTITVEVKEPDGAEWRNTENVSPARFGTSDVVPGRLGYQLLVPDSAWMRPPRRGGPTRLAVTIAPRQAEAFTAAFTLPWP